MTKSSLSIRDAWDKSPGPQNLAQGAALALKGFCMGAADIIPGVSGGTIAFITGIYDQLVDAIRSLDLHAVKRLLQLDISGFISCFHLKFFIFLLFGLGAAVVGMARVMHYLLTSHPVEIWSLFFGLIAASIWVVGKRVEGFTFARVLLCVFGAAASYLLVGMIPVTTPEQLWFIFFCGAIAICAMILPGISGAFILLMLGKYQYITGTLRNPLSSDNALVIAVFLAGAGLGIIVFSRLLHHLLSRWHAATISVLTGFMIGAMRKVWPWKEILESVMIRGRLHVLQEQNVLPSLDGNTLLAVGIMFVGVVLVTALERVSSRG